LTNGHERTQFFNALAERSAEWRNVLEVPLA
jgi:hypothetical protein